MSIGGGRAGRIEAPAGATGCGELLHCALLSGAPLSGALLESTPWFARSWFARSWAARSWAACSGPAVQRRFLERGPLQSRPPFRLEPQTLGLRPRPLLGLLAQARHPGGLFRGEAIPFSLTVHVAAPLAPPHLVRVALEHLDLLEFALEHDGRKAVGERASVDFRAGAVRARAKPDRWRAPSLSSCAAGSP